MEKRLIDYQKAREIVLDELKGKITTVTAVMLSTKMKYATVDAVEVVRCCVCEKHDHDGADGYCHIWDKWTKMSDFCSYGERKD